MSIAKGIKPVLEQFIKSGDHIKLISGSMNHLVTAMTKNMIVLDSSFNPPHKGHFSMIKGALTHNTASKVNVACINTSSVVLMLSVNNVDKQGVEIDQFCDRIALITEMSKLVESELGVQCGICVTKHGLFVDKSLDLQSLFGHQYQYDFLLGFDTLVRLFNKRYYPNGNVKDSLADFIAHNKLVVFLRKCDTLSIEDQTEYFAKLKANEIDGIPAEWSNSITLLQMRDFWWISSSEIRNLQASRDDRWRDMVLT